MSEVFDQDEEHQRLDCLLCGGTDGFHKPECTLSYAEWELPVCKKCGVNHPFAGECKPIEIPDTIPEDWN